MHKPSVEVSGATLRYPIGPHVSASMKGTLFSLLGCGEPARSRDYVTAFENVSFSAAAGDRLGIIGRNGAGKSSLLRALAGIYPLGEGSVRIRGHLQAMFETGLGFESEATGRENIGYRGLVLGMDRTLVANRRAEIIEFADIGKFIDLPMRMYSAGMHARLAFAISAFLEGDILLIDEAFATGDAEFQVKALARMREIVDRAGIVILVSHDLTLVEEFCTRVLWLDHGKVVEDGPPAAVKQAYLRSLC